jgi:hypothetical protein
MKHQNRDSRTWEGAPCDVDWFKKNIPDGLVEALVGLLATAETEAGDTEIWEISGRTKGVLGDRPQTHVHLVHHSKDQSNQQ